MVKFKYNRKQARELAKIFGGTIMKKTLSMILAIAATMTMAVTAFAQPTSAENTSEIIISADANGVDINKDTLLTPGKDYKFPLSVKIDGKTQDVTDEFLKSYTFRIENTSGRSTIDSFKVEKDSNKYVLKIAVKAGWPAKQTDAEYALKLVSKSGGKTLAENEISFRTGYEFASDSVIAGLQAGDHVTVDVARPVYSKAQLEKIAELNNYKKVTFTNGEWTYTANITDLSAINFLNNTSPIKDILTAYQDNDFKFVSFPAGPEFNSKGELVIDVLDIEEDFEGKFFVYRYLNGKLSKMNSTYVKDDGIIKLETSTLGRFVITDKEIKDGSIVDDSFGSSSSKPETKPEVKPETKPEQKPENGGNTDKPNPETGANNAAAIAVAVAAMAGVALVVSKKSK